MNQTELLRMAAMHGEGRGLNHWDQAKGWREAARVIREKRAAEDLAEHLNKSAKEKLPEHALTHVEANEMYNSDFVGTQMRCPTGCTLLHYVVLRVIHRRLQPRTAQRYIDVLLARHADCARADAYARTAADLDEERLFPVLHDLGAAAEAREAALAAERAAVDETEFVDTRGRRRRKKKKEEVEPVREDSPATKERKYQQRVQKEAKTWIEIQMKRFTKDDED